MPDLYADVGEFHAKFGLTNRLQYNTLPPQVPHLLADDKAIARIGHLLEELDEMIKAHSNGDLPGFADGIVDLVYVALGTAHFARIPFDAVWDEVHRANMLKERGVGKRGHGFDVIKPDGWTPPDIAKVMSDHGWTDGKASF